MTTSATQRRQFYRVREICELTGLSKAKIFQALHDGRLQALKLDGVLLVTAGSFDEWISQAVPWQPKRSLTEKSNAR